MHAALIKAPTWKGVQQVRQLAITERQNFTMAQHRMLKSHIHNYGVHNQRVSPRTPSAHSD